MQTVQTLDHSLVNMSCLQFFNLWHGFDQVTSTNALALCTLLLGSGKWDKFQKCGLSRELFWLERVSSDEYQRYNRIYALTRSGTISVYFRAVEH